MNPDDVTLEQHVTTELAKLGEQDPSLAERIRDLFPSGATGTGNGCIAEAMVRFLDALRAGELDQEQVLRIAGPYFNGSSPPDDTALFTRLANRGVHVVLWNSDTPLVNHLYKDFRVDTGHARRAINSRADRRGKVTEVLVSST